MNRRAALRGATVALLLLTSAAASRAAAPDSVRVVKNPRPAAASGLYTFNRAPLVPTQFIKLPIGAITPRGWIRKQLELDASGLVGHMSEVSDYLKYANNGWVDPKGTDGWEEVPYWLRGFGDLGYVLKDPRIIAEAKHWIDGMIASQRPDGWFGPESARTSLEGGPDMWPHMPMLNVLRSYYEVTHDARVIPFLTRFFRYMNTLPPPVFKRGWGAVRWGDNIDSVYWLYNHIGEAWLLELARHIHENSADYTNTIPTWHNVNLAQGIREPAEYWQQALDPKFLQATENDYQKVMTSYGQYPGGGFSGDENCRPGFHDPRQGFETCGIVEFMHTFEMMSRITGDPLWADRTEELAINSLPAALTPDHKGTHYITPANVVQIDNRGHTKAQFANGTFPMLAFKPGIHDYRCCPHNLGMGWPYYAEEMWLATADRGLCASLYGASEVTAKVGPGAGAEFTLTEATGYPFNDTVELTLTGPRAVQFPLWLRVPGWCTAPRLTVNGKRLSTAGAGPLTYLVVDRAWKSGDRVTLTLPMHVAVRTWKQNKDAVSVNYGPIAFSVDITEKWQRFSGAASWPEYEVFGQSPWNYGLALNDADPTRGMQVVKRGDPFTDQPFTHEGAPLGLRVKARRIPEWTTDGDDIIGLLQPSPALTREKVEPITMIPMGAARLRVTTLPVASDAPGAHVWKPSAQPWPKGTASKVFDNLDALADEIEPARSHDDSIPRFTWWDHRGSVEWASLEFEKPITVSKSAIYWYDDTGSGLCRIPASYRILYLDGTEWKPVQATEQYKVSIDRYSTVSFKPVTAKAFRVEVQLQPTFSSGILEWKLQP